jgi:hypothetical protein
MKPKNVFSPPAGAQAQHNQSVLGYGCGHFPQKVEVRGEHG